jgi:hypothetical protein
MDFGSILWLIIWSFFFISYLFVLFAIFGDLFRDASLGGGAKALWVIFLIFLPLLASLIYLIARGKGMGERQVAAVQAQKAATDQYIQSVAGTSPADQVAQAKALLDSGAIDAQEYETLKAKALS